MIDALALAIAGGSAPAVKPADPPAVPPVVRAESPGYLLNCACGDCKRNAAASKAMESARDDMVKTVQVQGGALKDKDKEIARLKAEVASLRREAEKPAPAAVPAPVAPALAPVRKGYWQRACVAGRCYLQWVDAP